MKKKVNFLVDNSGADEATINANLLSEIGNNYKDDINIIFGEELRIGQGGQDTSFVPTSDAIDSGICLYNFNAFDKCFVNGVEKKVDIESRQDGNTYIYDITYTEDDGSIVTPSRFYASYPNEYLEDNSLNMIINGSVVLSGDGTPISDNVYSHNKFNSFLVLESVDDTAFFKDGMFSTLRTSSRDGKKYQWESIYLDPNSELAGSPSVEFVYQGENYKADSNNNIYRKEIDGNYSLFETDFMRTRDAYNGVHLLQFSSIEIGTGDIRQSVRYADVIDGVYHISDGITPPTYEKYSPSGKVEEIKTNFTIEKMIGGVKSEEVMNIVNSNLTIPTATEIATSIKNDAEFIASVKSSVLSSMNISLVAQDGTAITSNLVYDEPNNKYVLDYDTSLLDGTDYTIELSLD